MPECNRQTHDCIYRASIVSREKNKKKTLKLYFSKNKLQCKNVQIIKNYNVFFLKYKIRFKHSE